MKLSLYGFVVALIIANIAYGMEHREPSPIALEELIQAHDPQMSEKAAPVAVPAAAPQKKQKEINKSNTMTVQEVCRLTLYAITEKRLGAKK
jgi:hypothetical protein